MAVAFAAVIPIVVAPPAHAACVVVPATNSITITPGPPLEPFLGPITIPGTPEGLAGVCVEVTGSLDPQVDTAPVIQVGEGCGIPCFVVSWDGVATDVMTVTITVYVNGNPGTFQHTFGGSSGTGSFCINSGMPCP